MSISKKYFALLNRFCDQVEKEKKLETHPLVRKEAYDKGVAFCREYITLLEKTGRLMAAEIQYELLDHYMNDSLHLPGQPSFYMWTEISKLHDRLLNEEMDSRIKRK